MTEITFKNDPMTLAGNEVEEGQQAPDFTVLDNDLNEVSLSDYKGKKKLISVVPSIDTWVCDQQTRQFNEQAAEEDGVVLTISVDLPFAQKRWCASSGLDNVITLSDHRDLSFGKAYGVVMEDLRLLARSVFVVDANDQIVYKQIVAEGTDFPDFESALSAYRNA
ncbi:thiol peroxidase [Staphylococcus auricularis]|uniref:thiol peroxidase n=1 Tax=Staphylococcus auricularis TaxID=29379 RepID=UPI003EBF28F0